MPKLREKFVVNSKGKRVGVLIDVAEYQELLRAVEELESIRAYDAAKASGDETLPFESAIEEIERERR